MEPVTLPADFLQLTLRLILATLFGALIGINRELRQKPAGLRTHAMVALGAALVTVTSLALGTPGERGLEAASRVIQGIVAGVGFIGGGVILHRDDTKGVHGLTTAASIWVVATIGVAAGVGQWRSAAVGVALALLVLSVGGPIDRALRRLRPGETEPPAPSAR